MSLDGSAFDKAQDVASAVNQIAAVDSANLKGAATPDDDGVEVTLHVTFGDNTVTIDDSTPTESEPDTGKTANLKWDEMSWQELVSVASDHDVYGQGMDRDDVIEALQGIDANSPYHDDDGDSTPDKSEPDTDDHRVDVARLKTLAGRHILPETRKADSWDGLLELPEKSYNGLVNSFVSDRSDRVEFFAHRYNWCPVCGENAVTRSFYDTCKDCDDDGTDTDNDDNDNDGTGTDGMTAADLEAEIRANYTGLNAVEVGRVVGLVKDDGMGVYDAVTEVQG